MQILNKLLYAIGFKNPPKSEFFENVLTEEISQILAEKGLSSKGSIYSFKSDMSFGEKYEDCIVFFDEKGVYCAALNYPENTKKAPKSRMNFKPFVTEIKAVPIEEIDEIHLEKNLSAGNLTYEFKGEYYSLCSFSLSKISFAEKFQKVFNAYKKNENYKIYLEEAVESKGPKGSEVKGSKPVAIRLLHFFKDFKPQMLFVVFSIFISSIFTIIVPKFSTEILYDKILNPGNTESYQVLFKGLITVVVILGALKILIQLFNVFYSYIMEGILPKVIYQIKLQVFSAMQRLTLSFYTHKQTGSLMERVTRDSLNIYSFFVNGFPRFVTSAVTLIGVTIMMLITSPFLTIIMYSLALVIGLLAPFVNKKFQAFHHKQWVENATLTSLVSDNINGHRIIKAFSKEEEEVKIFNKTSEKLFKAEVVSANAKSTVFPILSAFIYFIGAVVIAIGGVMAVNEKGLTVGELLTFVVYLTMLQEPIDFLSWVIEWWAKCVDSARRIYEIIDAEPEIKEPESPVQIKELKGEIELKNIHFQYESATPIINGLSLKLKEGEALGIVGKTGAGKTTISNLIARLYDADQGEVLIDGVNVKNLKTDFLRKNIGIVSQDIYLFMGTIMDNIRYAKPDATPEEVIAAAKAASAHDFITRLPDAYETYVGSGGNDLSGGEKQRISIARTIIQNPKILILDEATASMDTKTERNIQASLKNLQKNRTTIAIAHRLSTLRDSDKLAVIEKGRVIESGTYNELMEKKGAYYKMFTMQQKALSFIGVRENKKEEREGEIYDSFTKKSRN